MTAIVIVTDEYETEIENPDFTKELLDAAENRPDDLWDLLDNIRSNADPSSTVYLRDDDGKLIKLLGG